jgi:hypothetical protein
MWLKPILICPLFLSAFWRPLALIILFFDLMFTQNPHTMLDSRLVNGVLFFCTLHDVASLYLSLICASSFSTICIFSSLEIVWNKLVMQLCPSFSTMLHNVETNLNWKSIRFVKGKGVWKEERKLRKCKKCQLKYQVPSMYPKWSQLAIIV